MTFKQPTDLFTPQANYRNSDPESSKLGAIAAESSGAAPTLRAKCLRMVRERPGFTTGEYAKQHDVEKSTFSRRLAELKNLGMIRTGALRPCTVSGRKCLPWYPVEEPHDAN